jgi:hypothetical protein
MVEQKSGCLQIKSSNWGAINTGTTGHFLIVTSNVIGKQPTKQPIHVKLPDGKYISSTHTGYIPLPKLPQSTKKAHLFPDLVANALISVGTLCNHGCKATFMANKVIIMHHNDIILTGHQKSPGLWITNLDDPNANKPSILPSHTSNSIVNQKTLQELVQYLHATCFSPVPSTLIKAINKGHFISWPGLTTTAV